ncbi:MAG: aminoglycoside phosphotransferase family protein [Aureliella sp.]
MHIPSRVMADLLVPNRASVVVRASGGLSDSAVFKCDGPGEQLCLRRWSSGRSRYQYILWIQSQIAKALSAGIDPLPAHFVCSNGDPLLVDGEDVWELTQWKPGAADYLASPSRRRLKAAAQLLARLHLVFKPDQRIQKSPAIEQRLSILDDAIRWANGIVSAQVVSSSGSAIDPTGQTQQLIEQNLFRTQRLVRGHGTQMLARLERLAAEPIPCHFVLRDVWSAHLLFSGDEVTGLIDFGAARIDEPATDLARMLGSLEPADVSNWQFGFEMYRELNPDVRLQRVLLLDQVSCLLSANQWRIWVTEQRREFRVSVEWQVERWKLFLDRFEHFDWRSFFQSESDYEAI